MFIQLDAAVLPDGGTRLQTRAVNPVALVGDLPAAVQACLPVSVARYAAAIGPRRPIKAVNPRLAEMRLRLGYEPESPADIKRGMAFAARKLHAAAAKEIYARLQPGSHVPDARLPFSTLGTQDQNLIGLAYFTACLSPVGILADSPPDYLVNFEDGIVHAGILPTDAGEKLSFAFGSPGKIPGIISTMAWETGVELGNARA